MAAIHGGRGRYVRRESVMMPFMEECPASKIISLNLIGRVSGMGKPYRLGNNSAPGGERKPAKEDKLVGMSEPVVQRARAGAGVRAAWAELPVKVGLLGTAIIAIGSLTPAYLPQASPMWPLLRAMGLAGQFGRVFGTVLTISGVFLLVDAWFRLRHTKYDHLRPLVVVALWSLPFLISPPIFSHDMYSYGAQGWMIHQGQNPYDGGPTLVPGPFSDYVSWVWRYTTAPYGPLALQISHLIAVTSGGYPWLAAYLMRIPALIGVACIVHFLPIIARRLGADLHQVSWFACLNPLLVIDYVGGGHNDAWMMGLVVLGLWVATKPRWWPLAAVVIGMATSIKQPAIFAALFLPVLISPVGSWRETRAMGVAIGKAAAGLAISAATFVGISYACGLGFGWIQALSVPGTVGSISPSYQVGRLIQGFVDPNGTTWLEGTESVVTAMGLVFIVYVTARYGWRRPMKALSWAWITLALTASALHSWYLLWGGLLLPMARDKRNVPWPAVLVVILMLCYAGINLGDRNGFFSIIAAIVCLAAWLVHLVVYHRMWRLIRGHDTYRPDDKIPSEERK